MYANTENYVDGLSLPGYPNLRPPRSLAELSNYGPSYSRHSSYSSTARSSSRTSISSTHSAQTSSLSGYSVEEENGPEPQRRSRQRYASLASQSSLSTLSTLSPLSSLSGSTLSAPSPLSRPSTVSAPSPLSSLSTLSAPSPLSRTSSTVSTSSRYSASSSSTATLCETSLESKDPDWQLCSDYYVGAVLRNVDLLAHFKVETPGLPRFPARVIQMGGRNHLTGKPRLLSLYECGLKSARRNMLVPPDERVFASEPWNKPLIFKLTWPGHYIDHRFDMEEFSGTSRDNLTRETVCCALAIAYHNLTIEYLNGMCDENCPCGAVGIQLLRLLLGDIALDAEDGTWNANIYCLVRAEK